MLEKNNTGNGPGNKMNMRTTILEGILKAHEQTGCSARVNSLKQVIKRSRLDHVGNAADSLDAMRKIFQKEIQREMQQILDRHIRTTFSPAFENLKRNGHNVDEALIAELCVNILESTKAPYLKHLPPKPVTEKPNLKRGYESDDSDVTVLSHTSETKRRKTKTKEEEITGQVDLTPWSTTEAMKWSPERLQTSAKFLSAAKIAAMMSLPVTILFSKFPRVFRYSCDEEDKRELFEQKKVNLMTGRCYLMLIDDVTEILERPCPELEYTAFGLSEKMLAKIRGRIQPTFERLKTRAQQTSWNYPAGGNSVTPM